MRRRRETADQSMDSLMDTLTNVVGILMFVLMITMLSVNDAVRQVIRAESGFERKEVTEKDLQSARERSEQLGQQVRALASAETKVRVSLTAEREALKKLKTSPQDIPSDPKPLEEQVRRQKQLVEQLAKQVTEAKTKLQTVGADLAATPELEEQAAKVVRLPDPRSAPKDTTQELYFCRAGRVMYVNLGAIQKQAKALADREVKPEKGEIDCAALIAAFKKRPIGDKNFALEIQVVNGHPYGLLVRKPEAGESVQELEETGSAYRQKLFKTNLKREYLKFLVWNDSFEVYLRAREIADDMGFMAGWQPTASPAEFLFYLPGVTHLRCKGTPPPPPPTGAPPAAPQGPPKPTDVID